MDFWSAVKSCFAKYATFRGRAPRSEYWYFTLFCVLLSIAASFLDAALFHQQSGALSGIEALVTILPSLAVSVRRLHDVDKSGWWLLMIFVPILGWILLLVWNCTRGMTGVNRFGDDPLPAAIPA